MGILHVGFVLLSAFGSAAESPYRVGVLVWSANIPGQVAMREGLEAEAERINERARSNGGRPVALDVRVAGDGEAGIENQIAQMTGLVSAGVDLIIVQPCDNAALGAPLRAANEAGIPVVAYDQYIDGGELAAYRTSDNHQAGYLGGEYIASLFPNEREIRLVLVDYPHVSSTVERVDGFLAALAAMEQAFAITGRYAAVEPVGGRAAGEAILRDFPEAGSIDAVFTVNDGGGLAVVEALAAAGRGEIRMATVDGDPASVRNISEGRLTVIDAAQFCGPLGAEAMRAGYAILEGEEAVRHALMPVFPVTRETRDRYTSWEGPMPEPFVKPWPSASPRWSNALIVVEPKP